MRGLGSASRVLVAAQRAAGAVLVGAGAWSVSTAERAQDSQPVPPLFRFGVIADIQ